MTASKLYATENFENGIKKPDMVLPGPKMCNATPPQKKKNIEVSKKK